MAYDLIFNIAELGALVGAVGISFKVVYDLAQLKQEIKDLKAIVMNWFKPPQVK
jgi:hypothetical protein